MQIIFVSDKSKESTYCLKTIEEVGKQWDKSLKNQGLLAKFRKKNKFFLKQGLTGIEIQKSKEERVSISFQDDIKETITYYLTSTEKEGVEWLKQKTETITSEMNILILQYFSDSQINVKYMKGYLNRGRKNNIVRKIATVPYNDVDHMQRIEDEYNETVKIKYLSKAYRKILERVAKDEYEEYRKKVKEDKVNASSNIVDA